MKNLRSAAKRMIYRAPRAAPALLDAKRHRRIGSGRAHGGCGACQERHRNQDHEQVLDHDDDAPYLRSKSEHGFCIGSHWRVLNSRRENFNTNAASDRIPSVTGHLFSASNPRPPPSLPHSVDVRSSPEISSQTVRSGSSVDQDIAQPAGRFKVHAVARSRSGDAIGCRLTHFLQRCRCPFVHRDALFFKLSRKPRVGGKALFG